VLHFLCSRSYFFTFLFSVLLTYSLKISSVLFLAHPVRSHFWFVAGGYRGGVYVALRREFPHLRRHRAQFSLRAACSPATRMPVSCHVLPPRNRNRKWKYDGRQHAGNAPDQHDQGFANRLICCWIVRTEELNI